jgi:hypothetical protein
MMTWPETQAWAAARVQKHLRLVAAKLEYPTARVMLNLDDQVEVRRGEIVFCEMDDGGWAAVSLEALLAVGELSC